MPFPVRHRHEWESWPSRWEAGPHKARRFEWRMRLCRAQPLKPLLLRSPQSARVELVPFPVLHRQEWESWPFRFGIGTSRTCGLSGWKLGRVKRDVSSGARGCVGPQRLKPLLLRSPQTGTSGTRALPGSASARVGVVAFPVLQRHESDLWPFRLEAWPHKARRFEWGTRLCRASAAEAASVAVSANWHEWNSCPSRFGSGTSGSRGLPGGSLAA